MITRDESSRVRLHEHLEDPVFCTTSLLIGLKLANFLVNPSQLQIRLILSLF